MGRPPGTPPRRLPGAPAQVGAAVLDHLGLPADDELLELAEIGVTTFEAALTHGSPDLLADFLEFAARRVQVLTGRSVPAARVSALPRRLLGSTSSATDLSASEGLLDRALTAVADHGTPLRADLDPAARSYLAHALAGRQDAAIAVVVDAARAGTDLAVLLTEVLEPAQQEIGRLWEEGAISVAQEHYCTAVTQLAMASLYPLLFGRPGRPTPRPRPRLVAAQAGGSLHEVGLRMVTDLLEHAGWDTTYLGTVTDAELAVEALVQHDAQVLALSASMPAQVSAVATLIEGVRADPRTAHVKVVVGGRPFLVAPDLGTAVGADGVARDAREAVALCARLVRCGDVAV